MTSVEQGYYHSPGEEVTIAEGTSYIDYEMSIKQHSYSDDGDDDYKFIDSSEVDDIQHGGVRKFIEAHPYEDDKDVATANFRKLVDILKLTGYREAKLEKVARQYNQEEDGVEEQEREVIDTYINPNIEHKKYPCSYCRIRRNGGGNGGVAIDFNANLFNPPDVPNEDTLEKSNFVLITNSCGAVAKRDNWPCNGIKTNNVCNCGECDSCWSCEHCREENDIFWQYDMDSEDEDGLGLTTKKYEIIEKQREEGEIWRQENDEGYCDSSDWW